MVEVFYRDQGRLTALREILGKTPDLERLCSRLAMDRAHAKDLLSVKNALSGFDALEAVIRELDSQTSWSFESHDAELLAADQQSALCALRKLLEQGIAEDPSILLTEGNLIRPGYNKKLDELRRLKDNGRGMLEAYLVEERDATGIPSLKIRYNRLIGYFFEVTKVHLSKVPPHFIRRQGIVQGERFTTDRLAALESDINGASDKITELERKLFLEIRDQARTLVPQLTVAARMIAELDAAQSLARAATIRGWVRPSLDNENHLEILEGRHPVVEAHLPGGEFIPNDIILDEKGILFALITGPNMAGKSTYLRQAALITIMAQTGSFVPAREARIGLTDRIYCRVGASDNLARGESTFLAEMNETAHILRTATKRSLVIMDEVGRGTGTCDGLSIAWAVCEELLDHIECRTLFATHYHELSMIGHPRMANRSMEVLDKDGQIVFLRKLREGSAAESYGLHVARLAGLSGGVLRRAAEIMARLKEGEKALYQVLPGTLPPDVPSPVSPPDAHSVEAPTVNAGPVARFLEDLASVDLNKLTPLEALNRINAWKVLIEGRRPDFRSAPQRSRSGGKDGHPSLFDDYP
jgi:DNA mismatch repair protein MutS